MGCFMILFITFVIALAAAVAGTHLSMLLARYLKVLDRPGEIKIHSEPIPRLGGLGIIFGFILAYAAVLLLFPKHPLTGTPALMCGLLLIGATGALDDYKGLRPQHKIIGQLLGGAVLFGPHVLGAFAGGRVDFRVLAFAIFTVFVVVLMSNSINLLDGMDGLVAGTAVIIAFFFTAVGFMWGDFKTVVLSLALAGACIGFLFFNYPPAKTFMGDAGSLFVGASLAYLALRLATVALYTQPVHALGILLILLFPLVDTTMAVARRLLNGRPIFSGDRLHIYDCLYRRRDGNVYSTIALTWLIVFFCGLAGMAVMLVSAAVAVVIFTAVLLMMVTLAFAVGSFSLPKWGKGPPAGPGGTRF